MVRVRENETLKTGNACWLEWGLDLAAVGNLHELSRRKSWHVFRESPGDRVERPAFGKGHLYEGLRRRRSERLGNLAKVVMHGDLEGSGLQFEAALLRDVLLKHLRVGDDASGFKSSRHARNVVSVRDDERHLLPRLSGRIHLTQHPKSVVATGHNCRTDRKQAQKSNDFGNAATWAIPFPFELIEIVGIVPLIIGPVVQYRRLRHGRAAFPSSHACNMTAAATLSTNLRRLVAEMFASISARSADTVVRRSSKVSTGTPTTLAS